MKPENPIDIAIKAVGSMSGLATRCDVTYQAIQRWRKDRIPADRVLQVSEATGWRVTPHELHPTMYPDPDWLPPNRGDAA